MTTQRIITKDGKYKLVSNYLTFKALLLKGWVVVAYIKGKDLRIELNKEV